VDDFGEINVSVESMSELDMMFCCLNRCVFLVFRGTAC